MTYGTRVLKAFGIGAVALGLTMAVTHDARADRMSEMGFNFSATPGGSSGSSWGGGWGWGGQISKQMVSFPKSFGVGTIVVSFSDRRLYKVLRGGRAMAYPIAAPRTISRWSGTLHVSYKRVNPDWSPTPTMRRENPKLPVVVKGGDPRNPLGVRALYLGDTMYRIHGTDAPWTIGQAVSKGCIRMYNEHAIELYNATGVGTRVVVTWKSYSSI